MRTTLSPRARRHAQRIINRSGRWFHPDPDCPHGTWSGYTYWGCKCLACLRAAHAYYVDSKARKAHNAAVIAASTVDTAPPLPVICTADLILTPPPPAPVPEPGVPELEWPPPPMTPGARAAVKSVDHLITICRAYYEPQAIYPDRTGDGRQRRRWGDVAVTVVPDGTVIFISEQETSDAPPTFLAARAHGIPKAKGGRGGRRSPTCTGDIIDALRKLKVAVEKDGNTHWRVELPGGGAYSFPSTPSKGNRSIENTVADLRRYGLAI